MELGVVFQEGLLEILMGLVLSFNIAVYKFLWDKTKGNEDEINKINESLSMMLNRMFGIDQDITDKGHVYETEKRIDEINDKLDKISERQEHLIREVNRDEGADKELFDFE